MVRIILILSMKPSTDNALIEELVSRGVERIFPATEFAVERLRSGDRLKVYLGIDPTGPTLHAGHIVPLKKLALFQKLGHEVILLIGDFTATIGDPDKLSVREPLTREQVLENAKLYQSQASRFLAFDGENPARLVYNSKWLNDMSFKDVLVLASKVSVQQMLERDMFQKRMEKQRPVYIHEYMYPLMQGYDSVAMGVDGEVGGNDQTFNMMMGRHLEKEFIGKEKFVIATKLLADTEGLKMGKTTGNMLALTDEPADMFGKVMSWTDSMIIPAFELLSSLSTDEIAKIKEGLAAGENPRDVKMLLAHTLIREFVGEKEADSARDAFTATFQRGAMPEDVQTVTAQSGEALAEVFLRAGVIESKTEYRRLAEGGAISNAEGEKIENPHAVVEASTTYKIGKRRFLKVSVTD